MAAIFDLRIGDVRILDSISKKFAFYVEEHFNNILKRVLCNIKVSRAAIGISRELAHLSTVLNAAGLIF
jgi:hypothetical protein